MVADELRNTLTGLHQLLGASPTLDADSRAMLRTVLHDIERALEGPEGGAVAAPGAGAAESPSSPVERLETLATRFEADHPALTGVLRQLTELLARAGI